MDESREMERFFALRSEIPVFLESSVSGDTSAYCGKLKEIPVSLRYGLPDRHHLASQPPQHTVAGERPNCV